MFKYDFMIGREGSMFIRNWVRKSRRLQAQCQVNQYLRWLKALQTGTLINFIPNVDQCDRGEPIILDDRE